MNGGYGTAWTLERKRRGDDCLRFDHPSPGPPFSTGSPVGALESEVCLGYDLIWAKDLPSLKSAIRFL